MADIIQLPIDTAANWTLYNPVLAEGMPGFESDTDKFKVGDGLSSWTELNYGAAVDLSPYATTSAVAAGYVPRITSVDNRLTRFDGTTGAVQSTGITVDDSHNVTGVVGLTASGVLVANGGVESRASAGANGIRLLHSGTGNSNIQAANGSGGAYDTFFSRQSAGVWQCGTAVNNANGSLALTNLTASGTVSANSFSDGYITWSAAQINRSSNFVELQYDGSGGVRCFGNTATPITLANNGNLTASGTLRVGGGTVVANILSATATLDFPSIGSNDTETLTITVTGAVAGDSVFLGCPAGLDAGLIFCASVTAADTVTVRMHNSSGGSIDPASGTFRATVIRF